MQAVISEHVACLSLSGVQKYLLKWFPKHKILSVTWF